MNLPILDTLTRSDCWSKHAEKIKLLSNSLKEFSLIYFEIACFFKIE